MLETDPGCTSSQKTNIETLSRIIHDAAEMVGRVADRAIQVHGGNGFMTELGLEMWYRDVRAMRLYEGTGEILRTNVAKTLGL